MNLLQETEIVPRGFAGRETLAIRKLGADDLDFALKLTWDEGWYYTRGELERMLKLDPDGSFVYEEDKPMGVITCVTYGRTGVVGHLVVHKDSRGKKIGNALIVKGIEYMKSRGAESMLLYATEDGAKLYVKHGFKIVRNVSCIHVANDPRPPDGTLRKCARVTRNDLPGIIEMDSRLFGDDRTPLIELLYDEFPRLAFKLEDHGKLCGYCFGRVTDTGFDLGPWSCTTGLKSDAESLLRAVLSELGKGTVYFGLFQENKQAIEIVSSLPTVRYWHTYLMVRGAERFSGGVDKVYGVAAFELG